MVATLDREFVLGPLTEIPAGEGREFVVGERRVAVYHTRSGGVYATQPTCPHRAGPLVDGLLGGEILICPLHAWKFDLATGQALMGNCGILTYPARLNEAGNIVVTVGNEVEKVDPASLTAEPVS